MAISNPTDPLALAVNYLVTPAVDIQLMEVSLALIPHVIILSLAVVETLVPRGMEYVRGFGSDAYRGCG